MVQLRAAIYMHAKAGYDVCNSIHIRLLSIAISTRIIGHHALDHPSSYVYPADVSPDDRRKVDWGLQMNSRELSVPNLCS